MRSVKICISVDDKLYTTFKQLYPHSLRQSVEALMRKAINDDTFLWNFINIPCFTYSEDKIV